MIPVLCALCRRICVCVRAGAFFTLSFSLCSLPCLQGSVGVRQVDYIDVFAVIKGLENNLQRACR